jgi:hypothetical protein
MLAGTAPAALRVLHGTFFGKELLQRGAQALRPWSIDQAITQAPGVQPGTQAGVFGAAAGLACRVGL